MAHKSGEELMQELVNAKSQLNINGKYFHYKHPEQHYTVTDVIIIEATDEVGVVYEANYSELEGVKFVRPFSEFFSDVETETGMVKRFQQVL